MVIYSLFTISLLMSKSKKSLNNGDFFNNVINHRKKIHSHLKIFRFLHIKNFVRSFFAAFIKKTCFHAQFSPLKKIIFVLPSG